MSPCQSVIIKPLQWINFKLALVFYSTTQRGHERRITTSGTPIRVPLNCNYGSCQVHPFYFYFEPLHCVWVVRGKVGALLFLTTFPNISAWRQTYRFNPVAVHFNVNLFPLFLLKKYSIAGCLAIAQLSKERRYKTPLNNTMNRNCGDWSPLYIVGEYSGCIAFNPTARLSSTYNNNQPVLGLDVIKKHSLLLFLSSP